MKALSPPKTATNVLRCTAATLFAIIVANQSIACATPQERIEGQQSISHQRVQVAEPFTVYWTVLAPKGSKVIFPTVNNWHDELDVVDQKDYSDIPLPNATAQRSWTRQLTLESLAAGTIEIPAIEIQILINNESQTIHSQPIQIQVQSILENRADPTRFRDIHSVVDLESVAPSQIWWAWWLVGGVSTCFLASIAVTWIWRRGKQLSPTAWATRELSILQQAIDGSTSISSENHQLSEQFMSKLSSIMRRFFELQYKLPASGLTSQELLVAIKKLMPPSDHSESSRTMIDGGERLFATVELVQFAGLRLSPIELNQAMADANALVAACCDHGANHRMEPKASNIASINFNAGEYSKV